MRAKIFNLVGPAGLEPAKASASGFTVRPLCRSGHRPIQLDKVQADEGTRTHNQTFTKRLLCQLSYVGSVAVFYKAVTPFVNSILPNSSAGEYRL